MDDKPAQAVPPAPDESVRIFLAARDTPCPGCGYNLRGIEQSACPECGRAIELTLARPGRSRGYLLFVVLALGWVLTAATMNSIREWSRIRVQATPRVQARSFRVMMSTTTGGGSLTQTFTSSSQTLTLNSNGVTVIQGGPTAPAAAAPIWGNVSPNSWMNLGWWSGLGVLGMAGLIAAIALRRRFNKDSPPWRLVGAAAVLFALYAGYHAILFSREFIL
jgi:hypothetical protein